MGQVFRQAEQYLDRLDKGVFVEIGTARDGDDDSTHTLRSWANRLGKTFYTVDIDPRWTERAKMLYYDNLVAVNSSGEDFLTKFSRGTEFISLLYLDNFDWDWHPDRSEAFVRDQQDRYRELGLEMTNVNSQRAHLRQAELAVECLSGTCLVICDDTWYNPHWGHYSGKSGAVVPFLLNRRFEVLYTEEQPVYGTILARGL